MTSRRTGAAVAALTAILGIGATGCSSDDAPEGSSGGLSPLGDQPASVTVDYRVDAPSGAADITYTEADGTLQIVDDAELPWSLEFTARRSEQAGASPNLSVTPADVLAPGSDTEELSCRVTVDDEVAAEQTGPLQVMCAVPDLRMAAAGD
ncbi:MmpS family transport accessory protein [Streptomyces sp. B6B3]|uniref:MmpS family transport accessory protein n=1 Tax=Streptomyces sp. B6B3 TaxID=3153570 RepID=UPI00325E24C0